MIGDNFVACKPCWHSIPSEVRFRIKMAYRSLGKKKTWMAQARENPEAWKELVAACSAAHQACIDVLNNPAYLPLDEIQKAMP